MFKKISDHLFYYMILVAILFFSFLLIYSTSDRGLQIIAIIFATVFYVFWGLLHHIVNHDLHAKIVVEYVLIGVFGLVATFFVLIAGGNL